MAVPVIVRALLLAGALVLAGCAQLGVAPTAADRFDLQLQGRVALRYGSEGGNARIDWRHSKAVDDMLISSSLGQGIARISREGADIQLRTADGKEYHAQNAEELTESVLGWRLPLAGLPDWVSGRPSPGTPAQVQRDESGRISRIEQDAWSIEYNAWEGEKPSRMLMRRAAGEGREGIEIRLVIDHLEQSEAGS